MLEHTVATMLATSVAASACVAVGGCGSEPLILPEEPGANGTVLVIDRLGVVSAIALEGDGAGFEIAPDRSEDLVAHVLYYEGTLPAVGLGAGPLAAAAPGAPWRSLPSFDRAKINSIVDGQALGFESIFELTGAARDFHLGLLDVIACLGAGGCASDPSELAGCATPCPAPTPPRAPEAPALPDPPLAPLMGPCREGFAETPLHGESLCLPAARTPCTSGQVQWIESAACTAIEACPASAYAEDLPTGVTAYVDPAGPNGDGSLGAPFSTVAAALASNAEIIAITSGTMPTPTVDRPVTIVGRCPELTIFEGDLAIPSTLTIRGATIRGKITVEGTATLSRLVIDGPGAGLESRGTVVADSIALADGAGPGVLVTEGTARLEHFAITGFGMGGVTASGTATVSLSRFTIEDLGSTEPDNGRGIDVRDAAVLTAEAGLILGGTGRGINASGGSVIARDLVIRDSRPAIDDRGGSGIVIDGGASFEGARLFIDGVRASGLSLGGGVVAMVNDLVVADVKERLQDSNDGQGIMIKDGAIAVVDRAHIELATTSGVSVAGTGTRATLNDLVVARTRSKAVDNTLGHGISIYDHAHLDFARMRLEDSRHRGFEVTAESSATGSDLTVLGTLPEASNGRSGQGLSATLMSNLQLERYLGRDNHSAGLETEGGGEHTVTDITISGTLPPIGEEYVPSAIKIRGGVARLTRVELVDNVHGGLTVEHDGIEAFVEDLRVTGSTIQAVKIGNGGRTRGARWALIENGSEGIALSGISSLEAEDLLIRGSISDASGSGSMRLGTGMTIDFAAVQLRRFAIVDNESFGVTFTEGEVTFEDGEISGHRVGVGVTVPNYPLARLTAGVRFANDVDIQQR
jgi:hypothetical protein